MFFALGKTQDVRFPNHDRLGSWWFSHDNGWQATETGWRKGYEHADIGHGNYAELDFSNDNIVLRHDPDRSFPLWWDESIQVLTNLLGSGRQIWADETFSLYNNRVVIKKSDGQKDIVDDILTKNKAVDLISENFIKKASRFDCVIGDIPKRLFLTGGIDTLTLAAALTATNQSIEYIDYIHFDFDFFTNVNHYNIRINHWGYIRPHHWIYPCALATGGCGDEYTMRGPDIIARWAAWNNIDLLNVLKKSQGYHVPYFLNEKNSKTISEWYKKRQMVREHYPSYKDFMHDMIDINANDHQHWHLGNTLHWTPFKDLKLFELFLRLDPDAMMNQIIDASVSKGIIEHIMPGASSLLSKSKNIDYRENFYKIEKFFRLTKF